MKLKNIVTIIVLVWFSKLVIAQEGMPVYSDYLTDNYYLLHPSMAGVASCSQIRLTGRRNWVGEKKSPGLYTLAYNQRITDRSGIGAQVFQDRNGFTSQGGAHLTYAHHVMFSRTEADLNMISFGLSAGLLQYKLDQSTFVADGDPLISDNVISNSEFNMDVGISYHRYNFYTHATVKNILANSGINEDQKITNNLRKLLISTGYTFNFPNKKWSFEPSILYLYRDGTKESSIDMNVKAYKDLNSSRFWGGLSYRVDLGTTEYFNDERIQIQRSNHLSPFVGFNFRNFVVAYTYSYQANKVVFNQNGFHQITLGFDLFCRKVKKACYCPAVN